MTDTDVDRAVERLERLTALAREVEALRVAGLLPTETDATKEGP